MFAAHKWPISVISRWVQSHSIPTRMLDYSHARMLAYERAIIAAGEQELATSIEVIDRESHVRHPSAPYQELLKLCRQVLGSVRDVQVANHEDELGKWSCMGRMGSRSESRHCALHSQGIASKSSRGQASSTHAAAGSKSSHKAVALRSNTSHSGRTKRQRRSDPPCLGTVKSTHHVGALLPPANGSATQA